MLVWRDNVWSLGSICTYGFVALHLDHWRVAAGMVTQRSAIGVSPDIDSRVVTCICVRYICRLYDGTVFYAHQSQYRTIRLCHVCYLSTWHSRCALLFTVMAILLVFLSYILRYDRLLVQFYRTRLQSRSVTSSSTHIGVAVSSLMANGWGYMRPMQLYDLSCGYSSVYVYSSYILALWSCSVHIPGLSYCSCDRVASVCSASRSGLWVSWQWTC